MGRILDLCAEVVAESEEGEDGLVLPPDAWERLQDRFTEEEVEDALSIVRENLVQTELVEAADSLSAYLVEWLGAWGDAESFARARGDGARLTVEGFGQLARRVDRTETILDVLRTDPAPDRRRFDALRRRLADLGIEAEMEVEAARDDRPRTQGDDDDE